jgi:hypothetical protein
MGRAVQITLGILTLIGGASYFFPPLWDRDSWKKFGVDMPNYPDLIAAHIGHTASNAAALILIFFAFYLLFVLPQRRMGDKVRQLKKRLSESPSNLKIPSTITFNDCHFYGSGEIAVPPDHSSVTRSQITGGQVVFPQEPPTESSQT